MRSKRLAGLGLALALGGGALTAVPAVVAPANAAVVASPVVTASKPKIKTNLPSYKMVTVNKTATFKVRASGTKLKYQWYQVSATGRYWKKVSGTAGKRSYLKVKATLAKAGSRYRVKVSNTKGTKYSRASWLYVRSTVAVPFGRGKISVTPHWAIQAGAYTYDQGNGTTVVEAPVMLQNYKYSSRNPKGNIVVQFRGNNGQLFGDQNVNGTFPGTTARGVATVGAVGKRAIKTAYAYFQVPTSLVRSGRVVVKDVASPAMTVYYAQ